MLHHEHVRLMKLIKNWEEAADRLENKPVNMTANTHRLFANELRAVLKRHVVVETRWQRFKSLFSR
jgi:hemerythrin-like domain-containing protein